MSSDHPPGADDPVKRLKAFSENPPGRGAPAGSGELSCAHWEELDAIYRYAPVGLCLLDTDLRYRRINERLADMNGVAAEDHIGRTLREIVPHLADQAEAQLIRILQTGEPLVGYEISGITAATPGLNRTWVVDVLPLRGKCAEPIGLNVVIQEITARKKAEEALRENERRLSLAISATTDAIWEWNLVTHQTYYSPRWYAMLGYEPDEISMDYDGWKSLCHPDDLQPTMAVIRSSLESGEEVYAAEFRMRSKDGAWRWILGRGRVVEHDAAGKPVLVSGTNTDITERKESEEALRRREALYRELVQNANSAIIHWNHDGAITFFNEYAQAFFGWSVEEVLGKHVGILLPAQDSKGMDLKGLVRDIVARPEQYVSNVNENVCRDGRRVWMAWTNRPILDEWGRVSGILAIGSDVTALKQAEAALIESEGKYRDLFENMTEEVHIWQVIRDPSGQIRTWRLVDVNPPALRTWGRATADEIRGRTTDEIFGPGATEHYLPVVEKIMTEGVPHAFEDYFPNLDKHFRFTSVPLGDRFITTGADITDIKKSELALREINEELSEYTYAVVHNLKAPFRAVQNYATFLIEDLKDRLTGEPKQFLDGIQSALGQANLQFNDLDALYRIRNYEVEFEAFDLRDLLDDIAASYRPDPDRQLILPEQGLVVRGERTLMRQILVELIHNGFKYNRSKIKRVEVRWRARADDALDIIVQDNGIGIDPKYHDHIFHIFKRLHTEEEYEGTGIGLAIVRRAAKKIGGELIIESALGRGSKFVIRLRAAMAT